MSYLPGLNADHASNASGKTRAKTTCSRYVQRRQVSCSPEQRDLTDGE